MKFLKTTLVIVVSVVLTTIAINAGDNRGDLSNSFLASFVGGVEESGPCPLGMVLVSSGDGDFCIDKYEASPSSQCPNPEPANQSETRENLGTPNCNAVSSESATPWRFISQSQAAESCAKAGKRLPTNREWYQAALGTPQGSVKDSTGCNIWNKDSGSPLNTGSNADCVSALGAYDMIGNVWEWVDETSHEGVYNDRMLPDSGYVHAVDTDGVPIETNREESDPNHGEDYFWTDKNRVVGMFRGGYWGGDSDMGLYSIYAAMQPSYAGGAVGFRCVK